MSQAQAQVKWVLEDIERLRIVYLWTIADADIVYNDISGEFKDVTIVSDDVEYTFDEYFEDMAVVATVIDKDVAHVLAVHPLDKTVDLLLYRFNIARR